MDKSKYSTMRVAIIFLAIVSIVLAAVHVVGLTKDEGDDRPQADLSVYGSEPEVSQSDGLIFDDDATMEMDSIPNDAMTSGADVSGADVVSAADAG